MIFCFSFFNDILIYSSCLLNHVCNLLLNFELLASNHFVAKLSKCVFSVPSVDYLDHVISINGVTPDPTKIQEILNSPKPCSLTTLRFFYASLTLIDGLCAFTPLMLHQLIQHLQHLRKNDRNSCIVSFIIFQYLNSWNRCLSCCYWCCHISRGSSFSFFQQKDMQSLAKYVHVCLWDVHYHNNCKKNGINIWLEDILHVFR